MALSREKVLSIGLKSELYGGRKRRVAPAALILSLTAARLWLERLSMMTTSPGPQLGHWNLYLIGFEPVAVDRPIQHHRRDHAGHAQARDQRGGLAVPVWEAHPQPLAIPATTVTAGHVGGGPGLIDEGESFAFEVLMAE